MTEKSSGAGIPVPAARSPRSSFKVSLLIFSSTAYLLLGSLILEVIARAVQPAPLSGIAYDRRLGWRFVPQFLGSPIFRTNSRGFRGAEIAPAPRAGTPRLLIVGDSYTAGTAIPEDATFANRLGRTLGMEVINAGVPAWSTDQQLLFLESEGFDLKPSAILLVFTPNDFRETFCKNFFKMDSSGKAEEAPLRTVPLKTRIGWWLSNHSSAFQWGQKRIWHSLYGDFRSVFSIFPVNCSLQNGTLFLDKDLFSRFAPAEVALAKELTLQLLTRIAQGAKARGIPFYVSAVPIRAMTDGSLPATSSDPEQPQKWVSDWARSRSVPFFDLYRSLPAAPRTAELYLKEDYHFSEAGHAWVAARLQESIRSVRTRNE